MKPSVDKMIVFFSALFLSFMLGFYSSRMFYFYKNEHKKVAKADNLIEYIKNQNINKKNLFIDNKKYIFKNDTKDNYLYYCGLMYRILYLNKDSIVVITDNDITKLKYGENNIEKWLKENYTVNLKKEYLKNTQVNLIDKKTFTLVGQKSYIIKDDFWGKDGLVVTKNGLTKSQTKSEFLGVRPIITLKNIKYLRGNGSASNPYIVEEKTPSIMNDLYIGEYLKYNNNLFRVVDKTNAGVKVVSVNSVGKHTFSRYHNNFNLTYFGDLAFYLNKNYIKNVNTNDLVQVNWYTGMYEDDYKTTYNNKFYGYIGILRVGDYFVSDIKNSFLLTKKDDKIYSIDKNGALFLDDIGTSLDVYPSFVFRKNIKINKGEGTKTNPYIIGG